MTRRLRTRKGLDDGTKSSEFKKSKKRWSACFRISFGLASIIIVAAQLIGMSRQTTTCGGGFIALLSLIMVWRQRKCIGPVQRKNRSFVSRWFFFPGYLLLSSIVFATCSIYFWSMPFASISAVCFIGWLLGRRILDNGWESLAPAWMLLFIICFPPGFALDSNGVLIRQVLELASAELDIHRVYHLLNGDDLTLIDVDQVVSLDPNVLLSSYHLFAIIATMVIWARLPAVMTLVTLFSAACSAILLQPCRVIVAGYVSRVQGSSEWMHDDITIQLLSTTIIGLLVLSFAGLTYTFLGPINSKRLKIMFANHPSSIWNRCFATTIGLLMVKGDSKRVQTETRSPPSECSSFKIFIHNYFASRRWGSAILVTPAVAVIVTSALNVGFVSADTNRSNVIAFYQSRFADSIRDAEFVASERLLDKLTILTPQFTKLESIL